MTLEAFNGNESVTVLPADENERILLQRLLAHRKLGRASVELAQASEQYARCIADTIEINRLITEKGIDGREVARRMQLPETFFDVIHGYAPASPDNA